MKYLNPLYEPPITSHEIHTLFDWFGKQFDFEQNDKENDPKRWLAYLNNFTKSDLKRGCIAIQKLKDKQPDMKIPPNLELFRNYCMRGL